MDVRQKWMSDIQKWMSDISKMDVRMSDISKIDIQFEISGYLTVTSK